MNKYTITDKQYNTLKEQISLFFEVVDKDEKINVASELIGMLRVLENNPEPCTNPWWYPNTTPTYPIYKTDKGTGSPAPDYYTITCNSPSPDTTITTTPNDPNIRLFCAEDDGWRTWPTKE